MQQSQPVYRNYETISKVIILDDSNNKSVCVFDESKKCINLCEFKTQAELDKERSDLNNKQAGLCMDAGVGPLSGVVVKGGNWNTAQCVYQMIPTVSGNLNSK